uniref:Uncharacterized protein n=1 Tax=Cacopsylla melanoneura TaxID=428564 RepID=A0A8D9BR91_9HEMI
MKRTECCVTSVAKGTKKWTWTPHPNDNYCARVRSQRSSECWSSDENCICSASNSDRNRRRMRLTRRCSRTPSACSPTRIHGILRSGGNWTPFNGKPCVQPSIPPF